MNPIAAPAPVPRLLAAFLWAVPAVRGQTAVAALISAGALRRPR